ncbi:MAG: phosphatase PAP2 family protein [Ignavibacteriaceae bacterium]
MKSELSFLLLLFSLLSSISFPQNSDWQNFKSVIGDAVTSPAHFDSKDFTNLGISFVAVSGAVLLENEVRIFSQKQRTPFLDDVFQKDKYFVEIVASLTALTYIYGWSAENEKTRRLGLKLTEAFLINGAITSALKFLLGRERPLTAPSNFSFHPFSTSWDRTSFPSGHTSTAFALSAVLANETDQLSLKIFVYSLASVVGVSRIYNNEHWLSDVVAGGMIGYFVGEFVSSHKTNNSDPALLPPPLLNLSIPLN